MSRPVPPAEPAHKTIVEEAFACLPGTTVTVQGSAILADTGDPRMKARFRRTSANVWRLEIALPDGSWVPDERGDLSVLVRDLVTAWRDVPLKTPAARRARASREKELRTLVASYFQGHTERLIAELSQMKPRAAASLSCTYDQMTWENGLPIGVHECDANGDPVRWVTTLLAKVKRGPFFVCESETAWQGVDRGALIHRAFIAWFSECWHRAARHIAVPAFLQQHDDDRRYSLQRKRWVAERD